MVWSPRTSASFPQAGHLKVGNGWLCTGRLRRSWAAMRKFWGERESPKVWEGTALRKEPEYGRDSECSCATLLEFFSDCAFSSIFLEIERSMDRDRRCCWKTSTGGHGQSSVGTGRELPKSLLNFSMSGARSLRVKLGCSLISRRTNGAVSTLDERKAAGAWTTFKNRCYLRVCGTS